MRFAWLGLTSLFASSVVLLAACGEDDGKKAAPSTDGGATDGGTAPVSEGGTGATQPELGGAAGAAEPAEGGASGQPLVDLCAPFPGAGTDVPNTIDADETWTAAGSPYRVSGSLYLTATLTLEPCVVVQLDADANILVGNDPEPGAIVAHGTSELVPEGAQAQRRIRFERLEPETPWSSISVDPTGMLDFEHVTVDGGGSVSSGTGAIIAYGADPEADTTPSLRLIQTQVSGSATYGINLRARAAFTDDSSDVSVVGSGNDAMPYPIYVEAGAVHSLPSPLQLSGNTIDEVLIHPFSPVFEDTFPARGVPLRLDGALYLQDAAANTGVATLTLEPGVDLRFDGGSSGVYVGVDANRTGRIVAPGTQTAPITLRSAQEPAAAGDWLGLYYRYPAAAGQVLSYVTIADAGGESGAQGFGCGPIENNASILLLSTDAMAPFIDHTTFSNAGGDTQILLGWSADADAASAAQGFFDTNTFSDAPACRVSLPRNTTNACPGNDAEEDCL